MCKNITMILVDEMAWNEHDRWLDAEIKINTPSWWVHSTDKHNMTKNRWNTISN